MSMILTSKKESVNGKKWSCIHHYKDTFTTAFNKEGVHRMHMHPQIFERTNQKILKIFALFELNAIMHPKILAPCNVPSLASLDSRFERLRL